MTNKTVAGGNHFCPEAFYLMRAIPVMVRIPPLRPEALIASGRNYFTEEKFEQQRRSVR